MFIKNCGDCGLDTDPGMLLLASTNEGRNIQITAVTTGCFSACSINLEANS